MIPPKLQGREIEAAHKHEGEEDHRYAERFSRLSRMAKEYVGSCIGCAAGDTYKPPEALAPRSMQGKPWLEVAVDFKGPIEGSKGYYFHTVINTYSRYPRYT